MPRPVDSRTTYLPGLDGVRAVAVIAVLGYHFGVPHMDGGLLGVSIFFTLSGFLITGILITAWQRTGRIPFGRFYLGRARRLLPALAVVLLTVLAVTALVERDQLGQRWRETVAAAFYVSNWFTIRTGTSYFDLFAGPSPLEHLWSLAVEEQFYLVWPVLLLVLLRVTGGRKPRVALLAAGLAAVSFLLLAVLAHPGIDNTRAYEGTDTRVGELLVGAALALVYRPARITFTPPPAVRAGVDVAGLAALLGIAWMVTSTSTFSVSLYRGGLLLLALLSALLLVAVSYPGSLSGRLLGSPVPRWLGERSYGIYLWHLPVVAFTPHHEPGAPGDWFWPATLDLTLTLLLASLSWTLIEDPVRRHGLRSLVRRPVVPYRRGTRPPRPVLAGALAVVAIATTAFSPASLMTASSSQDQVAAGGGVTPPEPSPPTPVARGGARRPDPRGPPARPRRHTAAGRTARTTACTSVVHVGDSTSIGLMDPDYLPDPKDRIDSQYRAGRGEERADRHPRRPLDRRALQGPAQRPGGDCEADRRRVRRLLGVRHGHQRGRQRRRRQQRRPRPAHRPDHAGDQGPAGDVAHGQDAAPVRPVGRGPDAEVERRADAGLRPLPEHARVRLGGAGAGPLVHPGRDPLHHARIPRAGPAYGPGAGRRVPGRRRLAGRLPGHSVRPLPCLSHTSGG